MSVSQDAASIAVDHCISDRSSPIAALARLGTYGKHKGNMESELHRYVAKRLPNPGFPLEPYTVKAVPHRCKRRPGITGKDVCVMLPHEVVAAYHSNPDIFKTCLLGDDGELELFWHRMADSEWVEQSTLKGDVQANPRKYIPVRLHGDDVSATKTTCLMCVTIASVFSSKLPADVAKLPIAVVPLLELSLDALDAIYSIIRWSLEVLFHGEWPDKDPYGQPWDLKSWRSKRRGPLAGGHRVVVSDIVGDLKYLKECMRLPFNYLMKKMCHLCRVEKGLRHEDSLVNVERFPHIPRRSHEEYMATFERSPPFARLPAFHLSCVRFDFMHVYCLGVVQIVVASTIQELMAENVFHHQDIRDKRERIQTQLREAYRRFAQWCRNNQQDHSQPMFTPERLNIHTTKPGTKPLMKSKAFNGMVILQWLQSVLSTHTPGRHGAHRLMMIRALCRLWDLVRQPTIWFSRAQARSYMRDTERFLHISKMFFMRATSARSKAWRIVPKHHAAWEMARYQMQTLRNPGSHMCFADESFVGSLKSVVPQLHANQKSSMRILQRIYIRHRLRLAGRESRVSGHIGQKRKLPCS